MSVPFARKVIRRLRHNPQPVDDSLASDRSSEPVVEEPLSVGSEELHIARGTKVHALPQSCLSVCVHPIEIDSRRLRVTRSCGRRMA